MIKRLKNKHSSTRAAKLARIKNHIAKSRWYLAEEYFPHCVRGVIPQPPKHLKVLFHDGECKLVDISLWLEARPQLRDPKIFNSAFPSCGHWGVTFWEDETTDIPWDELWEILPSESSVWEAPLPTCRVPLEHILDNLKRERGWRSSIRKQ